MADSAKNKVVLKTLKVKPELAREVQIEAKTTGKYGYDLAAESWELYKREKYKVVAMPITVKSDEIGPHIADDELHYVEALLDLLRGEDQFRPVAVSLLEAHKGKPPVRHRSKKEQA